MTMSGILDRLEKRGLINRIPDPTDSRAKLAAITDEGRDDRPNAPAHVGLEVLEEGACGAQRQGTRLSSRRSSRRVRDNLLGETARIKELQS